MYDDEWVRGTSSRVNKTRDHLETELKTAKINGIVVYTRKAYIEMGDFWLKCGDFLNALRCYTRSREYSQSSGDDVNSCLKITRVCNFRYFLFSVSLDGHPSSQLDTGKRLREAS